MKAWKLIQKGWCKRVYARRKNGTATFSNDKDAVKFCVVGAMSRCYSSVEFNEKFEKLYQYLIDNMLGDCVTDWNDSHSKKTVVKVLKELDI